jgi:histone acetyltransferase (RNA polymerase elongator complex component)
MTTIDATEARLSTHEEICALRYDQINARLKRLEAILMKTAAVMLLSMAGTIFSAVWILKDWAVAFIAAALVVAMTVWCAYIVIQLLRNL